MRPASFTAAAPPTNCHVTHKVSAMEASARDKNTPPMTAILDARPMRAIRLPRPEDEESASKSPPSSMKGESLRSTVTPRPHSTAPDTRFIQHESIVVPDKVAGQAAEDAKHHPPVCDMKRTICCGFSLNSCRSGL